MLPGMSKLKHFMLSNFFKFITSLFCGGAISPVVAQDVKQTNILFIGNSFTLMHEMPKTVQKMAGSKNIQTHIAMSAKGGHTIQMHAERSDLYEDINQQTWDYVVIQGMSKELSYGNEYIDSAIVPYFQKIVDTLKVNNPLVNILLYMTWGYEKGYHYGDTNYTFEEMGARIESGYRYLANLYDFPIVPVGNVWKEIREKYPQYDLYETDGYHPSNIGSYIIANTFFSALFHSNPAGVFIPRKVKENVAHNIQATAFNYVISNLSKYNLTKNTFNIELKSLVENQVIYYFEANYPNAESITWEFGDDTTSNEASTTHPYPSDMQFNVNLYVYEKHGIRRFSTKIHTKQGK